MDDKLTHHGIPKMKWGQRRYQNKDGSLTEAGKKRYAKKYRKETPEEFEARKKAALESGSAADVLKFKGQLTNTELDTVKKRLDFETKLSEISMSKVKSGQDKVKELIDKLDTANKAYTAVSKTYTNVTKLFEAIKNRKKSATP